MKKTKIICTLGPVSENKETMTKLIKAGMNVARFNFSHGDYEEHGARLKTVREINEELGTFVACLLDTKGPEIRTHEFDGKVEIVKGSELRIAFTPVLGNAQKFSVSYPGLYDDMKVGEYVTVDDGYLTLEVIGKDEVNRELIVKALNTHVVKSRRGVNVPNVVLNMPFISEKDASDIKFAATQGYDFVAASFVRRAQDVKDVRAILDANDGKDVQIIAKIENQEGVDNLDEIIEVVDGIMVARGDLGIEVPAENVPVYQTEMIDKCLDAGKIVIVATQMLESMQKNPRPTRAEVSDVFNAVREGTSATMLSGESAAGDYPVEAVTYMAKIDAKAEGVVDYDSFIDGFYIGESNEDAMAQAAAKMVLDYEVDAIIAEGRDVAKAISKFHAAVPVIAIVNDAKEARSLAINFGVYPVLSNEAAEAKLAEMGLADEAFVVVVNSDEVKLMQVK
ncbi:pyruvate kinase [Acholeplasma hippikon]|uniref:Pyruvate kinase n=1 Tax=Acholeplasma hippikon TaxID=264636 RepID=A0A449BLF8_9MOLU|nr:pyruvate kinase [Acholeplasma hippikon]VEU83268.1 pyruvate kinase [Acholeplasma hippikon]